MRGRQYLSPAGLFVEGHGYSWLPDPLLTFPTSKQAVSPNTVPLGSEALTSESEGDTSTQLRT